MPEAVRKCKPAAHSYPAFVTALSDGERKRTLKVVLPEDRKKESGGRLRSLFMFVTAMQINTCRPYRHQVALLVLQVFPQGYPSP